MKNIYRLASLMGLVILAVSCGDDDTIPQKPADIQEQQFLIKVESVGETAAQTVEENARSGRPLFSMSPNQAIDKVEWVLVRNDGTAEVVLRKEMAGWSDTDNRTSHTYVDGVKKGREAQVTLTGDERVEDGSYLAYAVGYSSGTYDNYRPFVQTITDGKLTGTEKVTVSEGGYADEIFAGAMIFEVKNGMFQSVSADGVDFATPELILRRQVAGTFGYFTGIPSEVGGQSVTHVRLVTTIRNTTILFGGFRSIENPSNFNQENVINGCNPSTSHDAMLDGSSVNDAFTVYDINLADWFPGENGLPEDVTGDGLFDRRDTNWRVDSEMETMGLKTAEGSVFGNAYCVAFPITRAEIDNGIPTFQLQLLGMEGQILKSWNVLLRGDMGLFAKRTVVSLKDDGTLNMVTEDNPEVPLTYSIVRNHLYTIGVKSQAPSYGEDEPVNLMREIHEDTLEMDVDAEWEGLSAIIFG